MQICQSLFCKRYECNFVLSYGSATITVTTQSGEYGASITVTGISNGIIIAFWQNVQDCKCNIFKKVGTSVTEVSNLGSYENKFTYNTVTATSVVIAVPAGSNAWATVVSAKIG